MCSTTPPYFVGMKTLTRRQLEKRKAQAVRFTRDARADRYRAEEIEDESLENYAEQEWIRYRAQQCAVGAQVKSKTVRHVVVRGRRARWLTRPGRNASVVWSVVASRPANDTRGEEKSRL
jgi:hypothetical protein